MNKPSRLLNLMRRPSVVIATLWLVLVLLAALWPSLLTSQSPTDQDLSVILQPPSREHLLGTTALGQDVLSRLVYGARPTVIGVLIAVSVALVLGTIGGLVAGYAGGLADSILSRLADLLFAVPGLIIVLVVYTVFPYNDMIGMATFGVILYAGLMRIVRSVVISARQEAFVDAARVSGLPSHLIVRRHLLPRVLPVLFVQATLIGAIVIIVQSGLAFLGFGPRPPAPSWGGMVAEGAAAILRQPWLIVPAGLVITLTVLAMSVLGESIRDESTAAWGATKLRRRPRPSGLQSAASTQAIDPTVLLQVDSLSIVFDQSADNAIEVVSGVSLSIAAGEVLGVLGESGCGKSVTATSVLGMLPGTGRISSGSVYFEGRDLAQEDESVLRDVRGRRIGFVSQEPMVSLDPTFRVGHQLREAVRRHLGLSRRQADERVVELLTAVGLPEPADVARRYPHQLSGGMAQRVVIAMALAGDPVLLIADEPTTALDVTVQSEILDLLRELARERGMAILLITHNWGVVANICDRVVVMYAGQVVETAAVTDLFGDAEHPYTRGLLRSNPGLAARGSRLAAIPGTVPAPADWPSGCRFSTRCDFAVDACRSGPVALTISEDAHAVRCISPESMAAGR